MTVIFNLVNGNLLKTEMRVPQRVNNAKLRRQVLSDFFGFCNDLKVEKDAEGKYIFRIIEGRLP